MTDADAVRLAERYIGAYNDRDLDAMLAVQDPNVVSYPAPLYGHRPHYGHAGVRAWWDSIEASGMWVTVVITEVRPIAPDRIAIIGEIHSIPGTPVNPWAVLVRVRNGLIVESHSYLSDRETLEKLGLLEAAAGG